VHIYEDVWGLLLRKYAYYSTNHLVFSYGT
jgi:hypothetical protein